MLNYSSVLWPLLRCPMSDVILPFCLLTSSTLFWISNSQDSPHKLPLFSTCDPYIEPSPCGANAVCGVLSMYAGCTSGVCMCQSSDFAPVFVNATDCGRVLRPGDPCTTNSDAAMLIPEFAQCIDSEISCDLGTVADNNSCVPRDSPNGMPGDICDDSSKCNEALGLECSRLTVRGRHCQCHSNLIFKNGLCQAAQFGDDCSNDEECNVIYNELPGGNRGICRNGTCDCGEQYIKVDAVVRTPPSTNLFDDMSASRFLGYYCYSTSVVDQLSGNLGENCTTPQPNSVDIPTSFCSKGLVCIHCTEMGKLTSGRCANATEMRLRDPPPKYNTSIPEITRPPSTTEIENTSFTTPTQEINSTAEPEARSEANVLETSIVLFSFVLFQLFR